MHVSKNNMIIPVSRDEYLLVNPLSGAVDIADAREVSLLQELKKGGAPELTEQERQYLLERGYLYHSPEDEEKRIVEEHRLFDREMETSPLQIFFVPTYGCDLNCRYCFQRDYRRGGLADREVIDAFFNHIEKTFAREAVPPFITLFGGEPLGPTAGHREIIDYFVRGVAARGLELAVVTNGYHLQDYLEIFDRVRIREIQVTVDGPQEIHDRRRPANNGRGTYQAIMAGVARALDRGLPINFRVVLDRENMPCLPRLADDVAARGWLKLSRAQFKTQLGRNYELYSCDRHPQSLFDAAAFWRAVRELAAAHPQVLEFHQPELAGIRSLALGGELPLPAFDTCPAGKKEWIYDYRGDIYGCTAAAGQLKYRLGRFYPSAEWDDAALKPWRERNIRSIPACRDCHISMLCGGGCGVVACEREGQVLAPDCRPVEEWWKTGIDLYREQLTALFAGGAENES